MQVSNPNNVKIYNLSDGKSLPAWLSDRKKRSIQQKDSAVRKRIELIQDFKMPILSNCIKASKDGQYIIATGIYKPRLRCYDVANLSMKFERCMDAEVVQFEIISDDYSKLVLLQCERFVEFHAQYGRYHRMRIPKLGRDLCYHHPSCDLYIGGVGREVFRLNLELGKFLNPLETDGSAVNVCKINPVHHAFVCGTVEGKIEVWDPRSRFRVGMLDCALSCVTEDTEVNGMPSITALNFKDGLTMGVGTETGQILIYDIRSDKPIYVKDHMYGLPIRRLDFHPGMDVVASMDTKILKLWDRTTGKVFTSIEPGRNLNDLCIIPNSGLILMANEDKRMLSYYIPSLGQAPKWCSFLDNLTEELEETTTETLYDDYKFVTKEELEDLSLANLIGTNLLRAYMHGYFIDIRLYNKAKSFADPFAFEKFKQQKIDDKIEEDRSNRVKIKDLPKVNKRLAELLLTHPDVHVSKKMKKFDTLMKDERFKALFENPEFEIDEKNEAYRMINPVLTKIRHRKNMRNRDMSKKFEPVEENQSSEDSSDDEKSWRNEVKKQFKSIRKAEVREQEDAPLMPKFYEIKTGETLATLNKPKKNDVAKVSLGERLQKEDESGSSMVTEPTIGNRLMTYALQKPQRFVKEQKANEEHFRERKKLRRSAKSVQGKSQERRWLKRLNNR